MNVFKVQLANGYMGIMKAENLKAARKKALAEHGTRNLVSLVVASKGDVMWFKSMGGKLR